MIVYHFPQEAAQEASAFTVAGQDYAAGTVSGELMLVPQGALPASEFSGCIFYLDTQAPAHLPICTRTLVPETLAASFPEIRSMFPRSFPAERCGCGWKTLWIRSRTGSGS